MSRHGNSGRPAQAKEEDRIDSVLAAKQAELEALERELKAKQQAKEERKQVAQLDARIASMKARVDRQDVADLGEDAALSAGPSLLYPDQTELPPGFRDPGRVYYWANEEDEGQMISNQYTKETLPPLKHADGTKQKHTMEARGHVLWSTPREVYERRKAQERYRADVEMRHAAALRPAGIPDDVAVGKDELPSR